MDECECECQENGLNLGPADEIPQLKVYLYLSRGASLLCILASIMPRGHSSSMTDDFVQIKFSHGRKTYIRYQVVEWILHLVYFIFSRLLIKDNTYA